MIDQIKTYLIVILASVCVYVGMDNYFLRKENKTLSESNAVLERDYSQCLVNSKKSKEVADIKEKALENLDNELVKIEDEFSSLKTKFDKLTSRKCAGVKKNENHSESSVLSDLTEFRGLLDTAACIANNDCKPSETPSKPL